MCDMSTRCSRGNRRAAGVGEQIQHPDLTAAPDGVPDEHREPVPVGGLLGEETGVLE